MIAIVILAIVSQQPLGLALSFYESRRNEIVQLRNEKSQQPLGLALSFYAGKSGLETRPAGRSQQPLGLALSFYKWYELRDCAGMYSSQQPLGLALSFYIRSSGSKDSVTSPVSLNSRLGLH